MLRLDNSLQVPAWRRLDKFLLLFMRRREALLYDSGVVVRIPGVQLAEFLLTSRS